jgi:hypothetical protein
MTEPVSFRTVLKFTALSVLFVCVLGYVLFQARFLLIGPQIVLSKTPDLLQNERSIHLEGTAYNISRLWLNDRPIYTDAQGNFKETVVLENGYTVATLRAEDRYGRETLVTEEFVYSPSSFIQ